MQWDVSFLRNSMDPKGVVSSWRQAFQREQGPVLSSLLNALVAEKIRLQCGPVSVFGQVSVQQSIPDLGLIEGHVDFRGCFGEATGWSAHGWIPEALYGVSGPR